MTMACHAERRPRQRERSAPHHRDRQVSPLGIGEEMRFVEDVASVAGLVPTGAGGVGIFLCLCLQYARQTNLS